MARPKSIDLRKIRSEALKMKIEPQRLMKRKINYRVAENELNCCRKCEHCLMVTFSGERRMQCEWIGFSGFKIADVEPDYVCDYQKIRNWKNSEVDAFEKNN